MVALPLLGSVLVSAAVAPLAPGARTERPLLFSGAGRVALTLDQDVYEHARADLGDLRVVDDQGQQVPYLLQKVEEEPPVAPRYPSFLNRTFVRDSSTGAVLDFRAPLLKDELHLSLSGDSFGRRVVVEGRTRREPEWVVLTDDAYVFALPEPAPARYEVVGLPENNFQFLRVTVFHGTDDPPRIEILDAWTRPQPRRRPREVVITPRITRAEDAATRDALVTLDLGARHQPFLGIQVEARDPQFFRGVVVDARLEESGPATPGPDLAWRYLTDGLLYRMPEPQGGESLRIDAFGRARMLRLTVKNRLRDRPLDVAGITVLVPVERVAFEALPNRSYRLTYGDPDLGPPTYDLARSAGDPALWSARAGEAQLGPPVRVPPPGAQAARPWSGQPALLVCGLASLITLVAAAWRARRNAA